MELEQRVIDLESRLAFQDDTIAALNDVLVEQRRELDRLHMQVQALASRQAEMAGQLGIVEDAAPPPHY